MNCQRILQALDTPAPLRCFDSVDSTNLQAKQWARQGAPFGAAVLADSQTAGRGRLGRGFYSPDGGLYLSLILPPQQSPGQLTTLAAVAVRRAVQTHAGVSLGIKWVNDLLLDGKKVCGILVEGLAEARGLTHAVLGIGLNTFDADFPQALRDSAGTLPVTHREPLAAAIINQVMAMLPRVPDHMAEYRAHCLTLGQRVAFEHEGVQRAGIARQVDEEGALWVDTRKEPLRLLAGEVSIRAEQGPAGHPPK